MQSRPTTRLVLPFGPRYLRWPNAKRPGPQDLATPSEFSSGHRRFGLRLCSELGELDLPHDLSLFVDCCAALRANLTVRGSASGWPGPGLPSAYSGENTMAARDTIGPAGWLAAAFAIAALASGAGTASASTDGSRDSPAGWRSASSSPPHGGTGYPSPRSTGRAGSGGRSSSPHPGAPTTLPRVAAAPIGSRPVITTQPWSARPAPTVSALAAVGNPVLDQSLADRPLAPLAAPTGWVVLAWSRRQLGSPTIHPANVARAHSVDAEPTKQAGIESHSAARATGRASVRQIVRYTFFNTAPTLDPTQLDIQSPAGTVTGNLNAIGPDGAVLTYSVTDNPGHGTVSINADASYTYTPDGELAMTGGTDQFTVTVDSNSAFQLAGIAGAVQELLHSLAQRAGLSAPDTVQAVVHVTVTALNHSPTASADALTTTENTPLRADLTANDTDPDGDPLTAQLVTQPTHGSATLEPTGALTYIPDTSFTGTDTFTYTVSDGPTTSAPATVTVLVDTRPEQSSTPAHLALAEQMVNEILPENNSYRNGTPTVRFTGIDGATSMYNQSDCSSFITKLLQATYDLTDAQFWAWTGFHRPGPHNYYDDAVADKGFIAFDSVNAIEAGDLFVIKYTGSQESNGHIALITASPTYLGISSRSGADGLLMYRLPVLDVTSTPHGSSDSRAATAQDGVGIGYMRLYTDADGNLVTYQWNNYSNGIIYPTTDRLATFAKIELPGE